MNPQLHSLSATCSNQSLFLLSMKWPVFSEQELILSHIVLVTFKNFFFFVLFFFNELNYTQTVVGTRVEFHTHLTLRVIV